LDAIIRARLPELDTRNEDRDYVVHRFLDGLSSYAETVMEDSEAEESGNTVKSSKSKGEERILPEAGPSILRPNASGSRQQQSLVKDLLLQIPMLRQQKKGNTESWVMNHKHSDASLNSQPSSFTLDKVLLHPLYWELEGYALSQNLAVLSQTYRNGFPGWLQSIDVRTGNLGPIIHGVLVASPVAVLRTFALSILNRKINLKCVATDGEIIAALTDRSDKFIQIWEAERASLKSVEK
jgi:hypothetical protein